MTGRPKAVLSIQSSVAFGHVGNSAATLPLQRLGIDVWPVLTTHFSNHPGYGSWLGPVFRTQDVRDVLAGLGDLSVIEQCDAILSGYLGDVGIGAVVADTVGRIRGTACRYCCDPVMGDVGPGLYVRPGIPELMRERLVPLADIVTPNQFELELLTGQSCADLDTAVAAASALRALGPGQVLVTSLRRNDGPPGRIEMLALGPEGSWLVATEELPIAVSGAGDMTAALFLGNLLRGHKLPEALARTAGSVIAVLRRTATAGAREMRLVEAQDALADPPHCPRPDKVA